MHEVTLRQPLVRRQSHTIEAVRTPDRLTRIACDRLAGCNGTADAATLLARRGTTVRGNSMTRPDLTNRSHSESRRWPHLSTLVEGVGPPSEPF